MIPVSRVADELAALVARTGPAILTDADGFVAALEDHLGHETIDRGVMNLLVDAVRQGTAGRLLRDVGQGADAYRAVQTHGDQLARDRATADSAPSRWAVAVLARAAGVIDDRVLTAFPPAGPPPAGPRPTGPPLAGPPPPRPPAQPPTLPLSPTVGAAPTRPPRSRRGAWIAAAVAAAVVLIGGAITAVVVITRDDDDASRADDSQDETADQTVTGGPTESATSPTADCEGKFPAGSAMQDLSQGGSITVGVRYDQPGIGYRDPASDAPTGFDVDVAKLLVADLCIDPESSAVTWTEIVSSNRESALQQGTVDLLVATYSISDARRAEVGQAGPYLVTGQQLLVREESAIDSFQDLSGKRVCAPEGSTTALNLTAQGAVLDPASTYVECVQRVVDGKVAATSTDASILLGYARTHPGELKVVGQPISEERYGVGYSLEAPEMCEWVTKVLAESFADGRWARAFQDNLGGPTIATPSTPTLDDCP